MDKALAKKSDINKIKYKFFINRIVTYFSFLLIPIWLNKVETLSLFTQAFILLVYLMFMGGQWYLFGKELDHRFKIYYKANSSLERIIYRLLFGNISLLLLFNIFLIAPNHLAPYIFWTFFGLIGLFYSWPTRGKIIEETMVGQFSEIRYLDSFEKTILALTVVTLLITMPAFPLFENIEALKLYLDPTEKVSSYLWNYLSLLFIPFKEYPRLYNLAFNFYFYFIGLGTFLFCFYCFLRYFFSRRLAMLGAYAVISSFSLSRFIVNDFFVSIISCVTLLWLWSFMWSSRSGTYRSGLFTGLIGFYISLFDPSFFLLLPVGIVMFFQFFMKNRTSWYRKQWLKYNILGVVLGLSVFGFNLDSIHWEAFGWMSVVYPFGDAIYRKAFFVISPLGIILVGLFVSKLSKYILTFATFDTKKLNEVLAGLFVLLAFALLISPVYLKGVATLWILSFFALFPIEWIFQSMSRLRSKRNLIYALYILVCLLDSQMENRIRIVGKMFLENESLKYLIQY